MRTHKKNNIDDNNTFGYVTSIILTVIPFILTKYHYFIDNKNILITILIICAIIQIIIHFVYFLHVNFSPNKIWNTVSLIFTILIITILIGGSTWIMNHLNHHGTH